MKNSIYTIGYQALSPQMLEDIVAGMRIDRLLDVRNAPFSKKPGFGKKELQMRFAERYEWRGDILGGKGDGIRREALEWLSAQEGRIMLLCMEDDPCRCHRYWLIARGLLDIGVECVHIQADNGFSTSDLLGRCGEHPPWERQGKLDFS